MREDMTSQLSSFGGANRGDGAAAQRDRPAAEGSTCDCSCSEVKLHPFIIQAELFGQKRSGLAFIFWLLKKKKLHLFQSWPFSYVDSWVHVCICVISSQRAREINTAGNGGQSGQRPADILRHPLSNRSWPHSLICAPVPSWLFSTYKKQKKKLSSNQTAGEITVTKSCSNQRDQAVCG